MSFGLGLLDLKDLSDLSDMSIMSDIYELSAIKRNFAVCTLKGYVKI